MIQVTEINKRYVPERDIYVPYENDIILNPAYIIKMDSGSPETTRILLNTGDVLTVKGTLAEIFQKIKDN